MLPRTYNAIVAHARRLPEAQRAASTEQTHQTCSVQKRICRERAMHPATGSLDLAARPIAKPARAGVGTQPMLRDFQRVDSKSLVAVSASSITSENGHGTAGGTARSRPSSMVVASDVQGSAPIAKAWEQASNNNPAANRAEVLRANKRLGQTRPRISRPKERATTVYNHRSA